MMGHDCFLRDRPQNCLLSTVHFHVLCLVPLLFFLESLLRDDVSNIPTLTSQTEKQLKAAPKMWDHFRGRFLLCKCFIPLFWTNFGENEGTSPSADIAPMITADEVHIKGENKNHSWTLKAIQQQCLPQKWQHGIHLFLVVKLLKGSQIYKFNS